MKVKILIYEDTDHCFVIGEVLAEPCKDLEECAWVQSDGRWFIYDLKTGKALWSDDSRAFLESRMWELKTQLSFIRATDIYARRVKQFEEMKSL